MTPRMHIIMIILLAVGLTGWYTYFGQMVPQKEVHPPEEVTVGASMSTEEMVKAGQMIFEGKGACIACHKLSGGTGRFPDLGTIGQIAGSRIEGKSDIEYLAESLYQPNEFIVPGYNPGMPPINKPPASLNDNEMKTVIAYLQSLGGTATIEMSTKLKWETEDSGEADAETPPVDAAPKTAMAPKDILTTFACTSCHAMDNPARLVGPSLFDIGKKLNKAQLYEAIMDPDATVADGYPPGTMSATLEGTGFYTKVSSAELKSLIGYLADLKGGK